MEFTFIYIYIYILANLVIWREGFIIYIKLLHIYRFHGAFVADLPPFHKDCDERGGGLGMGRRAVWHFVHKILETTSEL